MTNRLRIYTVENGAWTVSAGKKGEAIINYIMRGKKAAISRNSNVENLCPTTCLFSNCITDYIMTFTIYLYYYYLRNCIIYYIMVYYIVGLEDCK